MAALATAARGGEMPPELEALDAHLAAAEAEVPALRPGAEKRIFWADPQRRTPLALVYLHGFSASRSELSPVIEDAAREAGANLFMTRLSGHGQDGAAMAGASLAAWERDLDEAMAVGRRLGERVVLVGTSTGGSLAVVAAARPEVARDVAGLVLVAPNFGLRRRGGWLLRQPLAEWYLPLIFGPERGFEPLNPAHAAGWTTRYPTEALVPMARLAQAAWRTDLGALSLPALFVYSPADTVVDPGRIGAAPARWGGPAEVLEVTPGPGDDPAAHVVAGDALSPGQNAAVTAAIAGWLAALD
jgi:pimeloyl-ACP methyl ester carboxylesterase